MGRKGEECPETCIRITFLLEKGKGKWERRILSCFYTLSLFCFALCSPTLFRASSPKLSWGHSRLFFKRFVKGAF